MNASVLKTVTGALCVTASSAFASGGWFYEPPLPLSEYHERIPAKTSQNLIDEMRPRPADAATPEAVEKELRAIGDSLAAKPVQRASAIKAIDSLLEKNRVGDYRKRYANALWDLRDLVGNADAKDNEIAGYSAWRLSVLDNDDGFFAKAPAHNWSQNKDEYSNLLEDWRTANRAVIHEINERLEKSAPVLRPHFLVQRGAAAFKQNDFMAAAKDFSAVIEQFPNSPRAEVAQIMLARCRMEEFRENIRSKQPEKNDANPLAQATLDALEVYRAKYPSGRLVADLNGWEAGLARLGQFLPSDCASNG